VQGYLSKQERFLPLAKCKTFGLYPAEGGFDFTGEGGFSLKSFRSMAYRMSAMSEGR